VGDILVGRDKKLSYFHVWFSTKDRRRCLVAEIDSKIHELFNQISKDNNIRLLAHETMLDHAHLLIETDFENEIPVYIRLFKGSSARRLFQEFPMLKHQIKSNHLWAKRYAYKNIPKSALQIVINYINNQKSSLSLDHSPQFIVGS
jgi:putative transposase